MKRNMLKICSPGGAKANVMRKNGGAVHIVVPVDSVDAVENGDAEARLQSPLLEAVDHIRPIRRFRILKRLASSSTQHTSCTSKVKTGLLLSFF